MCSLPEALTEQSPSEAGERGGTGAPEPCDGAGEPGRWSRVAPRAVHRVPLFPQKAAPCVALARGRRAAVAGVSLRWDSVGTAGLGAQRVPLASPDSPWVCPCPARGGGTRQAVPNPTVRALLCHSRQQDWAGLGCAMLNQARPCCAMPRYAMLDHAVPGLAVLCHAVLGSAAPGHTLCDALWQPGQSWAGPHQASNPMPCCASPRPSHAGLYHARQTVPAPGHHVCATAVVLVCVPGLGYSVLCCAGLGCALPCCAIPCCAMMWQTLQYQDVLSQADCANFCQPHHMLYCAMPCQTVPY